MEAFESDELIAELERDDQAELYLEFLRVPAMSAGIYRLAAGSEDPQTPHAEDEIYVVLAGRAAIRVEAEDRPVERGSIVFVPAHAEHRFHSIDEDLKLLVLFAPAETLL